MPTSSPPMRIIASYDQHLYPWWERHTKSARDAGPALRRPSPPSHQLFNIDSVECTLKALDLAREQPFAFAFPRADDETRLPRTDDGASPDAAVVATNFETINLAVKFIDSVCRGLSPRFRFCEELLAYDTPRKRSVLVTSTSAARVLSPGDRKAAFMAFLPAVIAGFVGDGPHDWAAICLQFGVSEVISGKGETSSSFLVVDNTPGAAIIRDGGEHAAFVQRLVDAVVTPATFALTVPVAGAAPARVPVALEKLPRHFSTVGVCDDRPMCEMVFVSSRPYLLNTHIAGHLLTAGSRPRDGIGLCPSDNAIYGAESVSTLPDCALWDAGIKRLSAMLRTTRLTADAVMASTNAPGHARWNNTPGSPCPLCEGPCPHVNFRLMRVTGLMASCKRCPPGSCPVAGPLYAPVFGNLSTCARKACAKSITDANGVSRMAPVSDYNVPSGELTLPSAQPASGKSHTAKKQFLATLDAQKGESKFSMVIVPFQILASVYVTEMNNLFFANASPDLIAAYRLRGYLPLEPEADERDKYPFRHYEDVSAADFIANGGLVVTTCSSLHKFAPLYSTLDSYGRSRVGAVLIDEGETAPLMMIDPALVNNSSVENNMLNLFSVLRLVRAGVPVTWLDGFATDAISGACLRAAGVPFTELVCDVSPFAGRKITYVRSYVRNQDAVERNAKLLADGEVPSAEDRLAELKGLRTSVGGMLPLIIKSIRDGKNPQVLCSSKKQLHAIFSVVKQAFTTEGVVMRDFFTITGETSKDDRVAANAAAEGKAASQLGFGAIFTTSAVGGGLNFQITREVFAFIFRNLADAQQVWQTYLRSRNLEHIYVATWSLANLWDSRLYDSFRAVTDYTEWMDAHELVDAEEIAAEGEDAAAEVVGVHGAEDVASASMYGEHDEAGSPEPPAHLDAQAAVADEVDAARREYMEARAYTEGVDPAVLAAAELAEAEKRAALDAVLKKSKRAALAKGREVAAILTRYHKLLRTRTLLGELLGADGLSDGMMAAAIAPLSILLDFRDNHPRTVQPKSFKWAGRDVVLVPRPAPRVWTADDERGRHKETWKERGIIHKLQSLEAVNTTVFSDIHRQAKRHKAGEHEGLLHIAYEVNAIHRMIEESRLADLPAVNELIFELNAHHRNGPSRFFEEHEAIRTFMGFVRTEDLLTLDDSEVLEWDKKIVDVLKSQREQKFRADLTFALEQLCLGQDGSLWSSAEERTAAMIALQKRSEKKKSEMTAADLRTLDLYRLQLSFGIGDRFWVLWRDELRRAEQDEHAALKVCAVVKAWQELNGEGAAAAALRRMTRVVSELVLERDDAGEDKQRLFNFIYAESTKQVAKDDVYKVGNEPMKLMNAMAAVQHFGWAWLLDTTVLTIFPADPRIRAIIKDVASWTKQAPPNDDKPLYIHSICRVMNHALSSVGVKFAYEEPKERRPKAYRVFLESGLPRFLASELSATLGYSQWVAFFSIAKHTCSRRCREGLVFCPNAFSVAEETSRLRLKLTAVNAKLVDPQRALSAAVRDVNHARRMLDALDHTPEALLSDEGRWARRLRELEQLV